MANYSRSGEFELVRIELTTNTTNQVLIDLKDSYVDAIIYESIYENVITGSVSIVDTNNNIQKYGLGNGEVIDIEWYTSGVNTESVYISGVVYDIIGPTELSDHSSGFTLHFASAELINSLKARVFTGHNGTCSTIVEELFSRIARTSSKPIKPKPLITSPTRNIEHIVFTGQPCFQAISLCVNRSISADNMLGYLFYENNQEFKYVPLEELYKQEPVTQFKYNNKAVYENVKSSHEESFNNIQNFEYEEPNKHLDNVLDGQFGSSWGYVSLQDKTMKVIQTNSKDNFDETKSLGKTPNLLSSGFNDKYNDKLTIKYSQSHLPNQVTFANNSLKILKSNSVVVNIGMFGNSTLKVGTTCKASIPSFSSEDFSLDETDVVSGLFLIAEIKHVITPKQYNQRIKLIKDSFEGAVS